MNQSEDLKTELKACNIAFWVDFVFVILFFLIFMFTKHFLYVLGIVYFAFVAFSQISQSKKILKKLGREK